MFPEGPKDRLQIFFNFVTKKKKLRVKGRFDVMTQNDIVAEATRLDLSDIALFELWVTDNILIHIQRHRGLFLRVSILEAKLYIWLIVLTFRIYMRLA